jgi:flagellar hook-length control protein FliK
MGPIEISLTMDKGNATASFVSANADVREAIESALPRLREMFASAGINLGQTNVGAESFQQQAANSDANRSPSQWMSDNAILAADLAGSLPVRAFATQQGNRMVDIFA